MSVESGRRVVVFGLGGTIAMAAIEDGGVVPSLPAQRLIDAVPGLAETGVLVETTDFRRVSSASLTIGDILALSSVVREACASGVDGVVITQGTDTMEETAYVLDLLHTAAQPVVVTGAMRNPTLASADGPANVLAAIQVAASRQARGSGCLVVAADEIHAARRVRKTHSTSGTTFQSPNGGPLGYVVEGVPRFLNAPPQRFVLPFPSAMTAPRVGVLAVALDDGGELLPGADGRVDGLVVAGFGAGHVPEWFVEPLAELAATIPVVLASRTQAGSVLASTYGFAGSERDLLSRGLISAGFLDPFKARILLRAALALDANRDTIAAAFASAGGYGEPAMWPW
jgi:L-asparaginase